MLSRSRNQLPTPAVPISDVWAACLLPVGNETVKIPKVAKSAIELAVSQKMRCAMEDAVER